MSDLSWAGLMTIYIAGLNEGYAARCREEAERWQRESAVRVFVGGQFWERPTAADQRAERESIMKEAHAAGLHHLHRPACPLCVHVCAPSCMDPGTERARLCANRCVDGGRPCTNKACPCQSVTP